MTLKQRARRILQILTVLMGLGAPAFAAAGPYFGTSISTTTGIATRNLTGSLNLAGSTVTPAAYRITLDGATGLVSAGSMTVTGTLTATLTGNADTATALAANGANCSANQFNKGVDASGAAESCAALSDADVPDTITIDLAATATALAANGANCSAGNYPLGVDASGAVEGCTSASAGVGDVILASTQSHSGAKTFLSTTTFSGPVVMASTWGAIAPTTSMTGQSTFILCEATKTIVTSGGLVRFEISGPIALTSNTGHRAATIKVDSDFITSFIDGVTYTDTIGIANSEGGGTDEDISVHGIAISHLAAGSYEICLSVWSASGVAITVGTNAPLIWGAQEIPGTIP